MALALIKLTYRHIIDANAQTEVDRNIFHASYQEFRLKSQAYNLDGDMQTFTQMKAKDGRANSLHYKIGFTSQHFLVPLNNKIPVLRDTVNTTLYYDNAVFELIESDTKQIKAHQVAIKFITGTYVLHHIVGNNLILSLEDVLNDNREFTDTFTLPLQANLAITSYGAINARRATGTLIKSFKNN